VPSVWLTVHVVELTINLPLMNKWKSYICRDYKIRYQPDYILLYCVETYCTSKLNRWWLFRHSRAIFTLLSLPVFCVDEIMHIVHNETCWSWN